MSHLVDEGGEAVVESFDLFFLLDPHSLQVRVQLKIHGGQKARVNGHRLDGDPNRWHVPKPEIRVTLTGYLCTGAGI